MRNNRAPWELVLQHWRLTNYVRFGDLKSSTAKKICDIYEKWPILEHPHAYSLIKDDFLNYKITQDPIDYDGIKQWPEFFENIKKVCPLDKKKEKDLRIKHLFSLLHTEDDENTGKIHCIKLYYSWFVKRNF